MLLLVRLLLVRLLLLLLQLRLLLLLPCLLLKVLLLWRRHLQLGSRSGGGNKWGDVRHQVAQVKINGSRRVGVLCELDRDLCTALGRIVDDHSVPEATGPGPALCLEGGAGWGHIPQRCTLGQYRGG